MIFDCGETWKSYEARMKEWHPFFAIFPVTVEVRNGRKVCAAFQWVDRREWEVVEARRPYWNWQYRLPSHNGR